MDPPSADHFLVAKLRCDVATTVFSSSFWTRPTHWGKLGAAQWSIPQNEVKTVRMSCSSVRQKHYVDVWEVSRHFKRYAIQCVSGR